MRVVSVRPTEAVTPQLSVQRLGDLAGAVKLRANVWTLAAGDWSWGRHAHAEQEELYVVLEGAARIEADGDEFRLGPLEALAVPAGVPHQVWNDGEEPLTFLAAAAPAVSGDATPA